MSMKIKKNKKYKLCSQMFLILTGTGLIYWRWLGTLIKTELKLIQWELTKLESHCEVHMEISPSLSLWAFLGLIGLESSHSHWCWQHVETSAQTSLLMSALSLAALGVADVSGEPVCGVFPAAVCTILSCWLYDRPTDSRQNSDHSWPRPQITLCCA